MSLTTFIVVQYVTISFSINFHVLMLTFVIKVLGAD